MSERAYDSMTRRLANVDALQNKINQTTNPKEIAELQARIQIEQANIQAEQTRIQLASKPLDAERTLLQARAQQIGRASRRERVCTHVEIADVGVAIKKKKK